MWYRTQLPMQRTSLILLTLLIACFPVWPVLGADPDIVGVVTNAAGSPVNHVQITVFSTAGQQVGHTVTDLYGRYCIGGLVPGTYNMTASPLKTLDRDGKAVASLGTEGLTVDWTVSTTAPAVATAALGVASPATATCAGGWGTTTALATGGFFLLGGGITCGILCPGGGGGGGPPSPPPLTPSM
jgi:Carboxypeptidase regulatory-like domain